MNAWVLAIWVASQSQPPASAIPAIACTTTVAAGVSGAAAELCLGEQALTQAAAQRSVPEQDRLRRAAVQHYRRAVTLGANPEIQIRALEALEIVYGEKHLNEAEQVEAVLREIITLQPTEVGPVFRLAQVQEGRGLIDAAENTLVGVRQQHPTEADPYKMLAQFYARRAADLTRLAEFGKADQAPKGAAERDEHGIYRVGGPLEPPTREGVPQYPPEATVAAVQGAVKVDIVINETGTVTDAKVVRSVPLLDEEALRVVRQWRFAPSVINGQTVPVRMTVTVNFTLAK